MVSLRGRLRAGLLKSKDMTLKFIKDKRDVGNSLDDDILPVIKNPELADSQFDFACYKSYLKTNALGNTVFYTTVIKTTMTVFDGYVNRLNIVHKIAMGMYSENIVEFTGICFQIDVLCT